MLLASPVICIEKSSTDFPSLKQISESFFCRCSMLDSRTRCTPTWRYLVPTQADCAVRLVERDTSISGGTDRSMTVNASRSSFCYSSLLYFSQNFLTSRISQSKITERNWIENHGWRRRSIRTQVEYPPTVQPSIRSSKYKPKPIIQIQRPLKPNCKVTSHLTLGLISSAPPHRQ